MFDQVYFESLSRELDSLKNRVRSLIQDHHWQTDGEWKESVLRAFLRRQLPKSVQVGRGFVITDKTRSKQLDILIYDSKKPVLFQDGDLVFITPDAVLGIIEVKTSLNNSSFRKALENLCDNVELVQSKSAGRIVCGLFAFEDNAGNIKQSLRILQQVVDGKSSRVIHCLCMGSSTFIRYWNLDPIEGNQLLNKWHSYKLTEMAAGYFIHNIIEGICPQSVDENRTLWYPEEGKESRKTGEIGLKSA